MSEIIETKEKVLNLKKKKAVLSSQLLQVESEIELIQKSCPHSRHFETIPFHQSGTGICWMCDDSFSLDYLKSISSELIEI